MTAATVRAAVSMTALVADDAERVIAEHLRSDAGGNCLACGEVEPCPTRDLAHSVLFGNGRQLPRRRPLALVSNNGNLVPTGTPFYAFGSPE